MDTVIDKKFLDEFAYLGETAYLDVCSLGLQPGRTLALCESFQRDFVRSLGRICLGDYGNIRALAASRFAQLVGGAADAVGFTENTTQAFQLLCSGISFAPGEKVLLCPEDYPSVTHGWIGRGIPVYALPLREGKLNEDELIAILDREPIRAVALSFVMSCSGYKTDLRKVGTACRKRGILFCVDAIQGLGRNSINVEEMNIDILACGGFKGLLGVLGTAGFWCRPGLLKDMRPLFYDSDNLRVESDGTAKLTGQCGANLLAGSRNTYGIAALSESMGLLLEIGIDRIQESVAELEAYYRARLADLNLHWIGGEDAAHRSGNAVFLHDGTRTDRLARKLRERNIMVHLHPDRLRIGMDFYNTHEQIDRLADAIHEVFA